MEGFLSDLQFQPEELSGILDEALTRFEDSNEDVEASWNYLAAGLAAVRASAFEYWVKSGLDVVAKHSIRAYMHQDPISGRAFRKPRGYAGDAVLLDLIYNHPDVAGLLAESGGFGQRMYWAAQKARSANAVRQRRQLLASEIDRACKRTPKARVLSVACGHLREAEICPAIHRPDRRFPAGRVGLRDRRRYFGSDHQERLFPVRPKPARQHPEELVKRQECWPGLPALQYSKLLTKRQILQK